MVTNTRSIVVDIWDTMTLLSKFFKISILRPLVLTNSLFTFLVTKLQKVKFQVNKMRKEVIKVCNGLKLADKTRD